MKINVFNNNIMDENTYLITLGSSSIIIDPSYSYDKLSKEAKDNLKAVLLTHGHYDHFMEIESYKNHNLKFYMHQNAYTKLKDSVKNYSFMIRRNFETTLENEELVSIGGGIGQSRICLVMLEKVHIGEVQASLWSDKDIADLRSNNIELL